MLSTSNPKLYSIWLKRQEELISSFKSQPILIILRPQNIDLEHDYETSHLVSLIEQLDSQRIKHIEIAWSENPNWAHFMSWLKQRFPRITFGAASITSSRALKSVSQIGLNFAMSPTWDEALQVEARSLGQVLVPGVFSPSEIHRASKFGWKLIKLFPAVSLGINYINQLSIPIGPLPFVIAAGGLKIENIEPWLKNGYNAIVLGRGLLRGEKIDPNLRKWVESKKHSSI